MTNPKGAMAHGSIRQAFGQREEGRLAEIIAAYTEERAAHNAHVTELIETEKKLNQAVEDLELRESEYQSAISKANVASKLVREYQVKLKQAVEVLKFIARGNTQFPSWSATLDVLVEVRKLAAECVSSLSEQEDKP